MAMIWVEFERAQDGLCMGYCRKCFEVLCERVTCMSARLRLWERKQSCE